MVIPSHYTYLYLKRPTDLGYCIISEGFMEKGDVAEVRER
ncbi:hypothetical protein RSAG8_10702, partial [Rhizoctonia solani AG-8 WAC10335]